MRPVIRARPYLEGPVTCPRFPVAFRLPPFASWPSCPVPDFCLPRGRPTGGWSAPPDLNGVSMFRTGEIRPVSGASYTPGPWCSHGRASKLRPPLPRPSGRSCSSVVLPSPEVLVNEAYRGSHSFALPAFPLPVTPGWIVGPWASSRASHPAVTSDACQERGRALSTRSELTVDHSRPSISVISLTQCDLMSHLDGPVAADRVGRAAAGPAWSAGQAGDRVDDHGPPPPVCECRGSCGSPG